MKKFVVVGLAIISMCFLLTGCGQPQEQPAAGVSIANAEGQTLGFTYLYDLGNGYKLYADNFTKIVYLRYDYQGGKGATSVGSSSLSPYISPNGNYYKVNTQTRVIEEYIPAGNITPNPNPDSAITVETGSSDSQKSDIEAILNENGQKNENSNNQQRKDAEEAQNNEEGAESTPIDPNAQQPVEGENVPAEGENGEAPVE